MASSARSSSATAKAAAPSAKNTRRVWREKGAAAKPKAKPQTRPRSCSTSIAVERLLIALRKGDNVHNAIDQLAVLAMKHRIVIGYTADGKPEAMTLTTTCLKNIRTAFLHHTSNE